MNFYCLEESRRGDPNEREKDYVGGGKGIRWTSSLSLPRLSRRPARPDSEVYLLQRKDLWPKAEDYGNWRVADLDIDGQDIVPVSGL